MEKAAESKQLKVETPPRQTNQPNFRFHWLEFLAFFTTLLILILILLLAQGRREYSAEEAQLLRTIASKVESSRSAKLDSASSANLLEATDKLLKAVTALGSERHSKKSKSKPKSHAQRNPKKDAFSNKVPFEALLKIADSVVDDLMDMDRVTSRRRFNPPSKKLGEIFPQIFSSMDSKFPSDASPFPAPFFLSGEKNFEMENFLGNPLFQPALVSITNQDENDDPIFHMDPPDNFDSQRIPSLMDIFGFESLGKDRPKKILTFPSSPSFFPFEALDIPLANNDPAIPSTKPIMAPSTEMSPVEHRPTDSSVVDSILKAETEASSASDDSTTAKKAVGLESQNFDKQLIPSSSFAGDVELIKKDELIPELLDSNIKLDISKPSVSTEKPTIPLKSNDETGITRIFPDAPVLTSVAERGPFYDVKPLEQALSGLEEGRGGNQEPPKHMPAIDDLLVSNKPRLMFDDTSKDDFKAGNIEATTHQKPKNPFDFFFGSKSVEHDDQPLRKIMTKSNEFSPHTTPEHILLDEVPTEVPIEKFHRRGSSRFFDDPHFSSFPRGPFDFDNDREPIIQDDLIKDEFFPSGRSGGFFRNLASSEQYRNARTLKSGPPFGNLHADFGLQ